MGGLARGIERWAMGRVSVHLVDCDKQRQRPLLERRALKEQEVGNEPTQQHGNDGVCR
jgi:hypothetical protein